MSKICLREFCQSKDVAGNSNTAKKKRTIVNENELWKSWCLTRHTHPHAYIHTKLYRHARSIFKHLSTTPAIAIKYLNRDVKCKNRMDANVIVYVCVCVWMECARARKKSWNWRRARHTIHRIELMSWAHCKIARQQACERNTARKSV